MFDILGIGFPAVDIYYQLDCLPRTDGFCNILKTDTKPGGSGVNVIAQAANLGSSCTFLTVVGDDDIGREILKDLYDSSIDTGKVLVAEGTSSSHCKILLDPQGQKCILIDSGTAGKLSNTLISAQHEKEPDAEVLYTDLYPIAIARKYLPLYYEAGMTTIFNMQMALDPYKTLGISRNDILDLLPYTTVFAPCLLGLLDLTGQDSILAAHKEVRKHFSGIAVYTLGKEGVVAFSEEDHAYYCPAREVKAVDTTGAGDSFIGAFAHAYGVKKMSLPDSLRFATVCASWTCTEIGARSTPDGHQAAQACKEWDGCVTEESQLLNQILNASRI